MKNILLISTSGRAAGAAVCRGGEVVRSKLSDNGLTHSETIMPLIDGLFDDEIKLCDMDAVCADVGPGSFTGVRIGVCIANAMAYALKLPVIEVSSLRALADAIDTERPVCALIDARNGNGYAALYENGKELIAPKAVAVGEFIAELPQNTVFTGDGAKAYHDAIAAALPNAAFAAEEKHMLTADMLQSAPMASLNAAKHAKKRARCTLGQRRRSACIKRRSSRNERYCPPDAGDGYRQGIRA